MRHTLEQDKLPQVQAALPPAIREDHNPFAILGLTPGFQRLLIFVRWTGYKCPHCGHVFRRDFWPRTVWLGSGQCTCKECGMLFDDGSREWPELPFGSKLKLFLSPLAIGIWGGFVFAAVASLYIGPRDEHSWGVVLLVSALGLVPAIAWSPVPLTRMICSIRRYNSRRDTGAR